MLTKLNQLDPTNPNPQVVKTTVISRTPWVVYGVYVLDPKGCAGDYSSLTTGRREDGTVVAFGRMGTERLPAELDALKGEERYEAVTRWRRKQEQAAYDLIAKEITVPAEATLLNGEIEIFGEAAK